MTRRATNEKTRHQNPPKRLWEPCVSLQQIIGFVPDKPETYTPSPLMNAVLTAMHEVCPLSPAALEEHMGVDRKKLTGAIELLTGYKFIDLHSVWAHHKIEILKKEHPKWTLDQLAQAVGYADRTGIWHTEHRDKRKTEYREGRELTLRYLQRCQAEREAEYLRWKAQREQTQEAQEGGLTKFSPSANPENNSTNQNNEKTE